MRLYADYLHQFKTGIKNPTLQNYQKTLKSGLNLLGYFASEYEGLPVLKHLFDTAFDHNHLCSKIESYLVTNIGFHFYRYSRYDHQLKENFDLDFSKHDARSLLILIRCNYISQGGISKASNGLIDAYEYIERTKKKMSLESLKNALPDIPAKYIESRYKDDYKFSKQAELIKMIKGNLYLLSYDHKAFTQSETNGRIYNTFTNLNKVYRENELAFQLAEYDIKSANPQIIDFIYGWSNWKTVYSNLMEAYGIDRSEAKIKFNATLNNYKLNKRKAKEVYLNAGYNAEQSTVLATATATAQKGSWFRLMAEHEGRIMQSFINTNLKDIPNIRLHDAVYYEPEFYTVENNESHGIDFGNEILSKENLTLNLKMNTYQTAMTINSNFNFKTSQEFETNGRKVEYVDEHFTFYNKNFLIINANFNISKPIIEEGIYRTPTDLEFIERLKKLYKILYFLNESEQYFYECIEYLYTQNNGLSFNKNYVYEISKKWKFDINDGIEYFKNRNWTFHGEGLRHNDFQSKYYKARNQYINLIGRRSLKKDLKKLYVALQQNKLHFIDKKAYYNAKRYDTGFIIDQVHDLIGVKKKEGIENINSAVDHILDNPYNTTTYLVKNVVNLNISQLSKKMRVHRRVAKTYKILIENKTTILNKIHNAIQNIESTVSVENIFHPQISELKNVQTPTAMDAKEAFNYAIDYKNSTFANVEKDQAMMMSKQFFVEWNVFQVYKELFNNAKGGLTKFIEYDILKKRTTARQLYDENFGEAYANQMST